MANLAFDSPPKMRLRSADLLLLTILLLATPSGAIAQGQSESQAEGSLFLLLPVGAQGVSLGRAMTWIEGPEGAFWNPAGLAGVDRGQAVIFRSDHFIGTSTALSGLWSSASAGTLGVSYLLWDAGEIERTDEVGNPIGTSTIRNHLGIVSAATRLFDNVAAGLNFKVIRFQYSCRGLGCDEGTTATTYAIDAGIQALPSDRLRLGAMVAHLGPALQAKNAAQADPLPTRVRIAAAYNVVAEITDSEDLRGWLAVEVEDHLRDLGSTAVYIGTELTAGQEDVLSLRAGYVWADDDPTAGSRVGFGLRFERFDLSIAKSLGVSSPTGDSEPVHVTFAIAF